MQAGSNRVFMRAWGEHRTKRLKASLRIECTRQTKHFVYDYREYIVGTRPDGNRIVEIRIIVGARQALPQQEDSNENYLLAKWAEK